MAIKERKIDSETKLTMNQVGINEFILINPAIWVVLCSITLKHDSEDERKSISLQIFNNSELRQRMELWTNWNGNVQKYSHFF